MSTSVTLNAVSYTIPAQGEGNWGTNVSNYLIALSTGVLQKAGGTFTLTADVDFGATYGLKSVYFKSRNTPSTAGIVRLGNNESVGWRNAANSANLELKVNASNKLEFDGQDIPTIDIGAADTVLQMNAGGTTWEFAKIDNNNVDASAAIAYSKLNLATSIVNADVATAAAIARSKLASGTASYVLINSGAGVMSEEQYLDRTRGGTGITSTATFPSSGTVATTSNKLSAFAATTSSELAGVISDETGSGALVFGTAPTLDKPVVNQIDVTQGASATTPASGKSAVYVNSGDGKIHVVDSSGNDSAVGSGGAGARNYLSDWFDGIKSVGSVTNSITATGNVTISTTAWQASDTSKLTVANVTSAGIRGDAMTNSGAKSLKLDHVAVGAAFVQSPNFQLDLVDAGKPVMVRFDHGAVTTADDFQVMMVRYNSSGTYQEQINIAGTASATSPYSARLAAGSITTFNGFFIAGSTTTDYYALRFYRNNASDTTDIQIDSLYCGPQSVVQGAAVTDWVTYTPTNSNSTNATSTTQYRQVGDSIEIIGRVSWSGAGSGSSMTITLPTGMTADTTKYATGSSTDVMLGQAQFYDSGVAVTQMSVYPASTTTLGFWFSSANVAFDGSQGGASDVLTFRATVPIAGWSSNVTMANRAVEEFLYNTGTTATAGGSNSAATSAYGPSGTAILSIASTTANSSTYFDITLPSTAQQTDLWKLEVTNGFGGWIDAPAWITQGTSKYGMLAEQSSATNMRVYFGNKGARPTNATYAGDGEAWSGYSGYKWRVRKVASGASVGYPISSANIVGRTDGTTVGSGYIGETITATCSADTTTTLADTDTDVTGMSITLTPGVWELSYDVCLFVKRVATSATPAGRVRITDSSNNAIANTEGYMQFYSAVDNTTIGLSMNRSTVVNITTSTTYKVRVACNAAAATSTASVVASSIISGFTNPDNASVIKGIRTA